MGAAFDLYVPETWDSSIPEIMTSAGFRVTSTDAKLRDGPSGRSHVCIRGDIRITLTEVPLPEDPAYIYVLGLSRSRHRTTLLDARNALTRKGAVDLATYKKKSRGG